METRTVDPGGVLRRLECPNAPLPQGENVGTPVISAANTVPEQCLRSTRVPLNHDESEIFTTGATAHESQLTRWSIDIHGLERGEFIAIQVVPFKQR